MVEGTEVSLAQFIDENPEEILGKKHYAKYGNKLGVLVKLIDSAERLTIQVHPTREKARELFDSQFGKTECWHILGGREVNGEKPCIYFGFKEGITREHWKDVFDRQDIPAMLDCLHRFEVKPGDTFLIEGGIPHAIGAGCFLVEIQEPTDYTVRTERVTPAGLRVADFMCHQGCYGYEGKDASFGVGKNEWDNPFTDEVVLMRLANGGIARVTEGRTFAWKNPSSYVSAVYGTMGSYEFSNAQHILVERDLTSEKEAVILTDVSSYVNPEEMVKHELDEGFKNMVANGEWRGSKFSKIQAKEVARLPESYLDQPNGHMGSHKFLIDDFCTAAYLGKHPVVGAWKAARYTIPGLVAHKSALRGGETMDVPDCGEV